MGGVTEKSRGVIIVLGNHPINVRRHMMNWHDLQNLTADLFSDLGCDVSIEEIVIGARSSHEVDVLVKFKSFGISTTWIIECKHWKRKITKEKIMALRSISDDIGADRGIIVSSSGFQAGAIRAANNTNITLTDLEGLREITSQSICSLSLLDLQTRGYKVEHGLHALLTSIREDKNRWSSKPIHKSIDSGSIYRCMGKLVLLHESLKSARLGKPPYGYAWDESVDKVIHTFSIDEFIVHTRKAMSEAEAFLESQMWLIKGDV